MKNEKEKKKKEKIVWRTVFLSNSIKNIGKKKMTLGLPTVAIFH